MSLIHWDERYKVNNQELDDDHRNLFVVLNSLWRIVNREERKESVQEAIQTLHDGMAGHFSREEAFLKLHNYPRARQHFSEHQRYLSKLRALSEAIDQGHEQKFVLQSINFILEWFSNHILVSDLDYAEFIENRQKKSIKRKSIYSIGNIQYIIFIIFGIVFSSFVSFIIASAEREGENSRFQELAIQRVATVQANISIAVDTIAMLAGHFAATPVGQTGRDEFRQLVSTSLERHSFIQALEWVPRISRNQRPEIEQRMRDDGEMGFSISERQSDGTMRVSSERDEYFPVLFAAPVTGNERAIGFDLGSNPTRLEAINQSRNSGRIVSTARVTLVQEQGDQYGMLLFAPVIGRHADNIRSLPDRGGLIGFALGVFRIGDLISEGASKGKATTVNSTVDLYVYDMSASEGNRQLFPRSPEKAMGSLMGGLNMTSRVNVGGRDWLIVAVPRKVENSLTPPLNSLVVLFAGVISTAFLAYYHRNSIARVESAARFAREIARAREKVSEAHRIARLGFVEVNPADGTCQLGEGTQEMLGVDPACSGGEILEIFGKIDPADRDRLFALLSRSEGRTIDIELTAGERILHALGEVASAADPRETTVITLQDITQRKVAEQDRAKLIERMSEANRLESLGTLAGGVAHEINTPAQYISDNLEFVADRLPVLLEIIGSARTAAETGDWRTVTDLAQALKYEFIVRELPAAVEQSRFGIGRISSIVQAIKAFSYPNGVKPQPFDLNRTIGMAGTVTRSQWKHVAELNMELAQDLPMLNAIEGEINQVLVNLIVNAAQAIGEKQTSEVGRIDVRTAVVADMIEVSVADSGVGIPKKNLDRLYEMFFTTKPPGQGTGQGLAITRAIIQRHGGTITVESEQGKGACFRILLPISGILSPEAEVQTQ